MTRLLLKAFQQIDVSRRSASIPLPVEPYLRSDVDYHKTLFRFEFWIVYDQTV